MESLRSQLIALNSNSYDCFSQDWYGFSLPDDQKEAFTHTIQQDFLPVYAKDPERNRFRIAVCLSLIDSRTLPPQVRTDLGLSPQPPEHYDMPEYTCYPTLLSPTDEQPWDYQCSEANGKLEHTIDRIEDLIPDTDIEGKKYVAFELLGCLMGKVKGHRSGLCFQTTEFPNGAVFLKDVWYQPVDDHTPKIMGRFARQANALENSGTTVLYSSHTDPIITKNMVVSMNCGGVWQPTRSLFFRDEKNCPMDIDQDW